jgi:hypothetical protein
LLDFKRGSFIVSLFILLTWLNIQYKEEEEKMKPNWVLNNNKFQGIDRISKYKEAFIIFESSFSSNFFAIYWNYIRRKWNQFDFFTFLENFDIFWKILPFFKNLPVSKILAIF